MPRYVSLIKFAETGLRAMEKSPARAAAFRKAAEKAGVQVEAQLWTLGSYDGILILKGASESKIIAALTKLARQGYVRTEIMQAFDAAEFERLAGSP